MRSAIRASWSRMSSVRWGEPLGRCPRSLSKLAILGASPLMNRLVSLVEAAFPRSRTRLWMSSVTMFSSTARGAEGRVLKGDEVGGGLESYHMRSFFSRVGWIGDGKKDTLSWERSSTRPL